MKVDSGHTREMRSHKWLDITPEEPKMVAGEIEVCPYNLNLDK